MTVTAVLAIDLGTSGPKVAVVAADGTVLGSAAEPVTTTLLPGGGAEQDAREWWDAIVRATRRARAPDAAASATLVGVGATSQYSSTVAVDARGEPVRPVVLWLDTRGGPFNLPLLADDGFERWVELHGMLPLPSGNDGMGHMQLIRHTEPDAYERTHAFLEPVDYVNLLLTGEVAATQSTVFPMMVVDNRERGRVTYSDELVARSGIDPAKLPPLRPLDGTLGPVSARAAEALGIPAGLPVIMGANDSITAAIGSAALDRTAGAVIIGTTAVLVTHVDAKATDLEHGIFSVPSPVPDRYFVMAENGVGGRALELFLREVVYAADGFSPSGDDPMPSDAFERAEAVAATSPAGANGVVFLPWLSGSIAPAPSDQARGGFLNLGLATTRADLTRAVLEGVALNLAWLRPHVEAFASTSFDSLTFGGGGACSALWGQILADALGVPIRRLADPRATNARGAALLTFVRLGHLAWDDVASCLPVAAVHEPNPAHRRVYDHHLAQLQSAHAALAPLFAALNP